MGDALRIFWQFSSRYVPRYLWWYLAGFALIVVTQLLTVAVVEQTKQAIDACAAEGATARAVLPFAGVIALIAPAIVLIRTGSRLLVFTPGRLIEYHIRNDYYRNLLALQRDFFSRHDTGDLVSRCSNDIGFIRGAFGFGFLQVANVAATFVIVMAAMLRTDLRTTIYLAIPMMISFGIIQASIHYMFKYWRLANVQLGELSGFCLASYKSVSAVQNYHAEPAIERKFTDANRRYLATLATITRTRSFAIPLVYLVANLSVFLVLWAMGPRVIDGSLTLGEITAFLGYIAMITPPLLSLGWMLNVFNRAVPAMERLSEIIDAKPSLPEVHAGSAPHKGEDILLEARGLGFRFADTAGDPSTFALGDIGFALPQGKTLGVVGPIGSGKTALLDTVMRLNALAPGQLFLNGKDAAHMELAAFRDLFSFTSQKPLLFSASLRHNLLMALPAEQWESPEVEDKLARALEAAHFDLDPKQFPKGLETEVGEKGVMLSGGQRQRIALARCLLKDAAVYVLDDVLSAVDHETEKAIVANLRAFCPGKTFIIASHRVSAVQWADEILVLEGGRVAARGAHRDLVDRPGFYRDIYAYQAQHEDEDPWPS